MPKYKLDKKNSITQKAIALFFRVFLPAVIRAGVATVILTAFVLLTIPRYISLNDKFMWAVLALALFGLWKLLEHLDKTIEDFSYYIKRKCKVGVKKVSSAPEQLTKFDVTKLVDDEKGLSIFVQGHAGKREKHIILFEATYGYRNFDEGDIRLLLEGMGDPECGIYEIKHSEFSKWAAAQSLYQKTAYSRYQRLPERISHFMVISLNDVVDVLAYEHPIFIRNDGK